MLASNVKLVSPERAPPSAPAVEPATPLALKRRIVAYLDDDASIAALQSGLEGTAHAIDVRRGGLRHAIRFLQKDTDIHAIVVDTSGIEDALSALEDLARVCPPDVLVTAVGDNTDIGFYRTLVQGMGVTEYLPKPLTRDAVQTVLRPQLVGDEPELGNGRSGHLVAICGAQGGAGATSIAINLALHLADTTKATVALLDLHLQDGEAAVMLGARPGPGLRIALEEPVRADTLFLERTAIEINQRVRLIAADESLDDEIQITEAGIRHVIALLRRKFNYIIVDVPVPVIPAMRPVIALARHTLVLLEAEVTGLRNARSLRTLVTSIAGANRMFTVLNRADRPGGLPLATVTKGLGAAPDMIIPDLGRRMTEAVNQGVPAIRKLPALRHRLDPIVREITGMRINGTRVWFKGLFRS
jgi:pilus assembly protein CpaE